MVFIETVLFTKHLKDYLDDDEYRKLQKTRFIFLLSMQRMKCQIYQVVKRKY